MQTGKENEEGPRFSRLAAGKIQRALQTKEMKETARVLHILQMKQVIIGPLNDSHALGERGFHFKIAGCCICWLVTKNIQMVNVKEWSSF